MGIFFQTVPVVDTDPFISLLGAPHETCGSKRLILLDDKVSPDLIFCCLYLIADQNQTAGLLTARRCVVSQY